MMDFIAGSILWQKVLRVLVENRRPLIVDWYTIWFMCVWQQTWLYDFNCDK